MYKITQRNTRLHIAFKTHQDRLRHIEQHKFYPQAARKRGLEGAVQVSFRLLGEDRIEDLTVTGGHKLLRKSAEKAVRSALPLPEINGRLSLPQRVVFQINFELH